MSNVILKMLRSWRILAMHVMKKWLPGGFATDPVHTPRSGHYARNRPLE